MTGVHVYSRHRTLESVGDVFIKMTTFGEFVGLGAQQEDSTIEIDT